MTCHGFTRPRDHHLLSVQDVRLRICKLRNDCDMAGLVSASSCNFCLRMSNQTCRLALCSTAATVLTFLIALPESRYYTSEEHIMRRRYFLSRFYANLVGHHCIPSEMSLPFNLTLLALIPDGGGRVAGPLFQCLTSLNAVPLLVTSCGLAEDFASVVGRPR